MKALTFVAAFFSALSMANASSVYMYEMSCEAALAGNPAKGEPNVRTTLNLTFCGMDVSGQLIGENMEPAGFWSEESYVACPGDGAAGMAYEATRHDGSKYSGFILAADATPLSDGEDGREFVMGSCDGDICEGDSAYFRLSTVAEQEFSSIQLVRQGNNGALYYNFENAKCQSVDVMERQFQEQQATEDVDSTSGAEIVIID